MKQITSRKNPKIVHMKKLGQSREYRYETGQFLCDGEKLLLEALAHGSATCVLMSDGCKIKVPEDIETYFVPYDVLESVSPMKNPQSVLFSCSIPLHTGELEPGGRHIILENIQDPGNLGTIIRSANAFDIDSIVLVGSCADPYNPKSVRASMGAIFRQRIVRADYDDIRKLKGKGFCLIGADLDRDSRNISDIELDNSIIIIGSEGSGLSDDILSLCDEKVIIPMNPDSESLNAAVAASIIMWELTKR